jgi:glutamyl-tRNA reductase
LRQSENLSGVVVVLSTCNRTEVYAGCRRFHEGVEELVAFLARRAGCTLAALVPHLSVLHDDRALTHLFLVAAGAKSVVIGETEILGQVQRAAAAADEQGAVSTLLSRAFREALRTGRRARVETGVAAGRWSLPSVAVRRAADRFGSLNGRRALVVGAGEMGQAVTSALTRAGVDDISVAGRSTRLGPALELVDAVFSATTAPGWVLDQPLVAAVMARRPERPLVVVDLALPRDIDPDVAGIPGVTLFDLTDLRAASTDALAERRRHLPDVERLVAADVENFLQEAAARQMGPFVSALRCRVEEVRRAELQRWQGRIGPLNPEALAVVEAVTAGVVAKLLHGPTVRLKDIAGSSEADRYRDLLAELFDVRQEQGTSRSASCGT